MVIFQKYLKVEKDKETVSEGSLKESQERYATQDMIDQLHTSTLKLGVEGLYSCFDTDGVYVANKSYEPKTREVTFIINFELFSVYCIIY